jgi:hypothetical protein
MFLKPRDPSQHRPAAKLSLLKSPRLLEGWPPLEDLTLGTLPWDYTASLLSSLGLHGLSQLDLKKEPVTPEAELLEEGPALRPRGVVAVRRRTEPDGQEIVEEVIVQFAQTFHGAPVEDAGLDLLLAGQPIHLTAVCSYLVDVDATAFSLPERRDRILTASDLRFATGLPVPLDTFSGKTEERFFARWSVLPRDAVRRDRATPVLRVTFVTEESGERRDYLAYVSPDRQRTYAVQRLEAFASAPHPVRLFRHDPVSHPNGAARFRPNAPNLVLAAAPLETVDVPLCHDTPDNPATPLALAGRFVCVEEDPNLAIPPPQSPPADFAALQPRTNDFAAVSAYAHGNSMFALFESLGWSLQSLFNLARPVVAAGQCDTTPPFRMMHRAGITPGCRDGRCLNAKLEPANANNAAGQVDFYRFRFALGDATLNPAIAPLGIAADPRVVWHELSHALVYGTTGRLELLFAHSGGDALAAVLFDPRSRYFDQRDGFERERGRTYPWLGAPLRSHMRPAHRGWRWTGGIYDAQAYPSAGDRLGYMAEQILSSTLFWLYRAVGGEPPANRPAPVAGREFAALQVVNTFVGALARMQIAPVRDPATFARYLIKADRTTKLFSARVGGATRTRLGGAVGKVIHWAFEKQGLLAPEPPDQIANDEDMLTWPLAVDVFVDDRRSITEYDVRGRPVAGTRGGYDPAVTLKEWKADPSSVWLRAQNDGGSVDQLPVSGATSFVFVRVHNRGSKTAHNVTVTLYESDMASPVWQSDLNDPGNPQKGDFHRVGTANIAAVQGLAASPAGEVAPGIPWQPQQKRTYTLLVVVEADEDASNLAPGRGLACAAGPSPMAELVPFDNNLAVRILTIR